MLCARQKVGIGVGGIGEEERKDGDLEKYVLK